MKPGMVTPNSSASPPTDHSTPKNTSAASTAFMIPVPNSTTGSVATRASSAIRNSGASRSGAAMLRR